MNDTTDSTAERAAQTFGTSTHELDRLRRSSSDRYIAGVGGGIGRHFGIDPTVIRVLLAVLALFGGAGVIVYVAVWLFVPEDGRAKAPIEVGTENRKIVLIVAMAVAAMFFFGVGAGGGFPWPFAVLCVALAVLSFSLLRRRASVTESAAPGAVSPPAASPLGEPAPAWNATSTEPQGPAPMSSFTETNTETSTGSSGIQDHQPPAWTPPGSQSAYPPQPPAPRRTGLILFWPTLALIAIALGVLMVMDFNMDVPQAAYPAAALGVIGVMLTIGAFVGRAGGLILLGCMALLSTIGVSFASAATGGFEDAEEIRARPATAAAVADSYSTGNGTIDLDLSRVSDIAALDGRTIELDLGAGQIEVTLPPGVNAVIEADVDYGGNISINGADKGGWDVEARRSLTPHSATAPTLTIDAALNFGEIRVSGN